MNSYSQYGDAAIVVFSRIAGENWDLPRVAMDNPDHHYLQLDNNETALLKHICDSNKFAHVIVLDQLFQQHRLRLPEVRE